MTPATVKLSSPETREFWEIPVLFEDEHLFALDKPARLLASPDRYDPNRPNLMRLLHRDIERGARWAADRGMTYLANVHRLDFETSGVILLARNKPALIALANQFGTEQPHKIYVALAQGAPEEEAFTVEAALAADARLPGRMRVDSKNGKRAKTAFEVMERFRGYALLRCQPATGRTHQIRVHLRHAGLPLVGDLVYGGRPLLLSRLKKAYHLKPGQTERPLIDRVALHAASLTIAHPATGQPVLMEAPWPKDLTVAVKYLRRFSLP